MPCNKNQHGTIAILSQEWPKSEGEPVEIEFEDGNVSVPITPENYEVIKECWARGCGCEQAANPKMKASLLDHG